MNPTQPQPFAPGSDEKMALMQLRAARGIPLTQPGEPTLFQPPHISIQRQPREPIAYKTPFSYALERALTEPEE